MTAQFILGFDCEGLWGVADHLTHQHHCDLSDERLARAYRSIVDLLDDFRIQATFAFVGAFTQSCADFARLRPAIEQLRESVPHYLGPALDDIDASGGMGWHGDRLLDLVAESEIRHEIALHGVTHTPWTMMDATAAAAEMAMFDTLEGPVRASQTFVYPRNAVDHVELLGSNGFAGFRAAPRHRSRFQSALRDFHPFEAPRELPGPDAMIRIPPGTFFNWRSGFRALVPPPLMQFRARRLLRTAAARGATIHYWLHPENIAIAPGTLEALRIVLREVAAARDADICRVMTQLAYCADESLP